MLSALLLCAFLTHAQNHPCPDIHNVSRVPVSGTPTCRERIKVMASGDVSADKAINVSVYAGSNVTSGPTILNQCIVVKRGTSSTAYFSDIFTRLCTQAFTVVITRYTASNGECQGGTCGSQILLGGPAGGDLVLPVKLSSFLGIRKGNSVELKWKAESEINALEYQIERNLGNGFTKINTIPTKNSLTAIFYAIADNNTSAKISEYRLKMVDIDGSFKYSNVVAIKGTGAASDFTVFPNPVSKGSNAVVKIADITDATTLSVIDYTGKLIKQLPTNTSTINISNLQPGSYLIRINNSKTGGNTTQKLAVAN